MTADFLLAIRKSRNFLRCGLCFTLLTFTKLLANSFDAAHLIILGCSRHHVSPFNLNNSNCAFKVTTTCMSLAF